MVSFFTNITEKGMILEVLAFFMGYEMLFLHKAPAKKTF